jgi:hypothetical protein
VEARQGLIDEKSADQNADQQLQITFHSLVGGYILSLK